MILEGSTIKTSSLNSSRLGTFRQAFANQLGSRLVATIYAIGTNFFFDRAASHQSPPRLIIDQLGVDMRVAAKYRQARTLGSAMHALADAEFASLS